MNVFISGSDIFNIFEGIDFKKYKMAVTGSIMPACIQKNNPLSRMFTTTYRYFLEYYANSDVDVMIKTNNCLEFLEICDNIFNHMKENIINYFHYITIFSIGQTKISSAPSFLSLSIIFQKSS